MWNSVDATVFANKVSIVITFIIVFLIVIQFRFKRGK